MAISSFYKLTMIYHIQCVYKLGIQVLQVTSVLYSVVNHAGIGGKTSANCYYVVLIENSRLRLSQTLFSSFTFLLLGCGY